MSAVAQIGGLGFFALALATVSVCACSGHTCPSGGGAATVTVPAPGSSPIAGVSADAPCTAMLIATDGGPGEILVQTYSPGTSCQVRVQLVSGDAYAFYATFESRPVEGCGALFGVHSVSVPERLDAGAADDGGNLPVVPQGCGATCGTPAGMVQLLNSSEEAYAAVRGRWHICGNWPAGLAPAGTVGIEFGPPPAEPADSGTAEANAYYLVNGPSGPMRGEGFGYVLTYRIDLDDLTIYNGMGGAGGRIRYSPCPLEIEVNIASPAAILVPFGN